MMGSIKKWQKYVPQYGKTAFLAAKKPFSGRLFNGYGGQKSFATCVHAPYNDAAARFIGNALKDIKEDPYEEIQDFCRRYPFGVSFIGLYDASNQGQF